MVPLARLCLLSPRCERRSLPQERNISRPVLVPRLRRSGQYSGAFTNSPFASARLQPCPVASGGLLSQRGESRQRHAKGNLSRRRFPLESFPIGQGAAAPLRSPGDYGGRRTMDGRRGGLDGSCGLPHPLRGFAMTARKAGLKNAAGGRARGEAVICSSLYGIR